MRIMMASTYRDSTRAVSAMAELHFRTRQHDRFTAELAHADVERYPGTGRGLLENHRQRLARERLFRLRMPLQLRLHGGA
jgi:hypothetical protein